MNTFNFYLSKLNKSSNFLWQKPKQGRLNYTDEEWFEKNRVGEDLLNRYMKFLQKNVTLDGTYINHSVRMTVISKLDADGFEARHIIKLSSHKNESTVKEYAVQCPDYKRKEMFTSLSNAMQPRLKKIKPKRNATSTIPVPPKDNNDSQNETGTDNKLPDIQDVKENLPNFNLEQMENFDTIDDSVLQDLLTDEFNYDNILMPSNPPTNPETMPPKTINTQVNTFNIPTQMPKMPRMPLMYFPNSTVTINYNFQK